MITFLPHQFDNISNRRAHFETTGPEIWQQTEGRVDAVTFSTGTGGTIAGKQQTQRPLLTTTVLKTTTLFLPNQKSQAFTYSTTVETLHNSHRGAEERSPCREV